jgi:hypothetical protein
MSDTEEEMGLYQLFTDVNKACDWVRRDILRNILNEYSRPMKIIMLIKMCFKQPPVNSYVNICLTISYSEQPKTRRCFITIVFLTLP